jgi:hypothetical protein
LRDAVYAMAPNLVGDSTPPEDDGTRVKVTRKAFLALAKRDLGMA